LADRQAKQLEVMRKLANQKFQGPVKIIEGPDGLKAE
jgi:hypothetical protein